MNPNKAFTLVEVVVATAIFIVGYGIAFSMMASYQTAVGAQRRETLIVQAAARAVDDMTGAMRAARVVTLDNNTPDFVRFQVPVDPDGNGYLDASRAVRWGTRVGNTSYEGGWCVYRFVRQTVDGQPVTVSEPALGRDVNGNGDATEVLEVGRIVAEYHSTGDVTADPVAQLNLTPDIVVQVKGSPSADGQQIFGFDQTSVTTTLPVIDRGGAVPVVRHVTSSAELRNWVAAGE